MPVRYPPDRTPAPGGKQSSRNRIVAYREPPAHSWQRVARRFFSPPVVIPLVFLGTIVIGVLIYYWTIFSHRIDNLLRGEVYTRSAGIYAAPKQLRVNETISEADLIAFLKRAGYVEKTQQADTSRGRYTVNGT